MEHLLHPPSDLIRTELLLLHQSDLSRMEHLLLHQSDLSRTELLLLHHHHHHPLSDLTPSLLCLHHPGQLQKLMGL